MKGNKKQQLTCSLEQNVNILKQILSDDDTVVYKFFKQLRTNNVKYCIVFVGAVSSKQTINDKIIRPIMENLLDKDISNTKIIDYILNRVITCRDIRKTSDIDAITGALLYGNTILLVDGIKEALLIDTKEWSTRAITEPDTERIIRGPREGFTESMEINLSLIRRKILSPNLKFKSLELGVVTRTKICICYIEGLANKKILKEMEKRLNGIKIDGILDSGYIQELIKDSSLSPFKTVGNTERPDIVAAKLLEGRVALICDGSPSVLTVPFIFIEYFQSNEDYYSSYVFASINRLLRIIAFFLSTSIPAIYLAIVAFHQEMVPTPLLLSIAAARKDVPFPTVLETILMIIVFDLLREAGIRMPAAIGQAISIVGALVLGEAAVTARFVSAPIVIVIALTGISSYLVPRLKPAVILIRILLVLSASFLGLYGYIISVIALFVYLMSIKSFGVPYMISTALIDTNDIKDTSIRAPWWLMHYRPKLIAVNPIRKTGAKPSGRR